MTILFNLCRQRSTFRDELFEIRPGNIGTARAELHAECIEIVT